MELLPVSQMALSDKRGAARRRDAHLSGIDLLTARRVARAPGTASAANCALQLTLSVVARSVPVIGQADGTGGRVPGPAIGGYRRGRSASVPRPSLLPGVAGPARRAFGRPRPAPGPCRPGARA